ncbi:Rrf2 family transcriptional regulator [Listeria costaricensis]|uniref:Rrf2 family transcriptional regulator n=1 Tax=Listeria costaricensis TaxID=2026604 RepID=UPI000C0894CF|nr:Rrf2 family transcriptional regulator [Listeria costaricensis]
MAISTRFSVAVHTLVLIDMNREKPLTSEFIAGSVGTNPVVIRRIMSQLKKAGLIYSAPGITETRLLKEADSITLLEVYRAVSADTALFDLHQHPNPACLVGANIQDSLDEIFQAATRKMEEELAAVSIADVAADILKKSKA